MKEEKIGQQNINIQKIKKEKMKEEILVKGVTQKIGVIRETFKINYNYNSIVLTLILYFVFQICRNNYIKQEQCPNQYNNDLKATLDKCQQATQYCENMLLTEKLGQEQVSKYRGECQIITQNEEEQKSDQNLQTQKNNQQNQQQYTLYNIKKNKQTKQQDQPNQIENHQQDQPKLEQPELTEKQYENCWNLEQPQQTEKTQQDQCILEQPELTEKQQEDQCNLEQPEFTEKQQEDQCNLEQPEFTEKKQEDQSNQTEYTQEALLDQPQGRIFQNLHKSNFKSFDLIYNEKFTKSFTMNDMNELYSKLFEFGANNVIFCLAAEKQELLTLVACDFPLKALLETQNRQLAQKSNSGQIFWYNYPGTALGFSSALNIELYVCDKYNPEDMKRLCISQNPNKFEGRIGNQNQLKQLEAYNIQVYMKKI